MHRAWTRPLIGCAFVAVLLTSGSAVAQDDDDPRLAEARAAFVEGRDHFDDERYRLAVESFQKAYDLLVEAGSPLAPTILYNIATALDELPDRQRDARDMYQRFLSETPRDGTENAELIHTVEERIRELDLSLEERDEDPTPTDEDPVRAPDPEPPSEGGISPIGPIVMGVGGAMLVVGGIMGIVALGQGNDFEEACPSLTGCDPALEADYDAMRTKSVVADVLLFSGLAVAAVGAVLTFTLKSKSDDDAVAVSAGCDGTGCMAMARGTFR